MERVCNSFVFWFCNPSVRKKNEQEGELMFELLSRRFETSGGVKFGNRIRRSPALKPYALLRTWIQI
jgi:hypothetical protein